MNVVKGAISIKDNATSVMQGIRKEQNAFRTDVEKTKQTLKKTWDAKYTAKLENTAATKKINELNKKMEPLRKKVVTAIAVKDLATEKVKKVSNQVKAVGKMVAKPVVNVAVKGMDALKSAGNAMKKAGKVAAVGMGAVVAVGGLALNAVFSDSLDYAKAQIEAETKLGAVLQNVASIQERGPDAWKEAQANLQGVASSLQEVGVIGDEVTLAGMQQLATFQMSDDVIAQLAPGMADLLAQQKGLNASQEDAVTYANMFGKVMQGNIGALSRVGITFTDSQAEALKTGNEVERAAVLAEILEQNVGGVNKALAETDQGKIQQMENNFGDMKEEVGKVGLAIKANFAGVINQNIPQIQQLGMSLMGIMQKSADKIMPVMDKAIKAVIPLVEKALPVIGNLADKVVSAIDGVFNALNGDTSGPLGALGLIVNGFKQMLPVFKQFGSTLMGTLQQVFTAMLPIVNTIILTIQDVLPTIMPVIETVVSTIANIFTQAAPLISFFVETIGTVIATLAPIFNTVFNEIGEKVSSVIGFIAGNMGFLRDVINAVVPLVSDIISTAWTVIGPVMDIAIAAFMAVFNVVKAVFPAVQKIISTVWELIKPVVEAIGKVMGKIADGLNWIGEKASKFGNKVKGWFGKGNDDGGDVDPETVSGEMFYVDEIAEPVVANTQEPATNALPEPSTNGIGEYSPSSADYPEPVIENLDITLDADDWLNDFDMPAYDSFSMPEPSADFSYATPSMAMGTPVEQHIDNSIEITLAKLAEAITIKEEVDIDVIGEQLASKIAMAVQNARPAPATT